jgi:hypothetical protein
MTALIKYIRSHQLSGTAYKLRCTLHNCCCRVRHRCTAPGVGSSAENGDHASRPKQYGILQLLCSLYHVLHSHALRMQGPASRHLINCKCTVLSRHTTSAAHTWPCGDKQPDTRLQLSVTMYAMHKRDARATQHLQRQASILELRRQRPEVQALPREACAIAGVLYCRSTACRIQSISIVRAYQIRCGRTTCPACH